MMNKIEKQTVLEKALRDTFNPQFLKFQEKLKKEALKKIPPRFIELINDEESKKYVATYSIGKVSLKSSDDQYYTSAIPEYGYSGNIPPKTFYSSDKGFKTIRITDLQVPYELSHIKIDNVRFFNEYIEMWGNYSAAYTKLSQLLFSYKNRLKFATDFPELAKYLPEKMEPAKLPVVQVDKVKADLYSLLIPAGRQ